MPVVVAVDGREPPGMALGWRGQRGYLCWVDDRALRYLGWKDAGQVSRRG